MILDEHAILKAMHELPGRHFYTIKGVYNELGYDDEETLRKKLNSLPKSVDWKQALGNCPLQYHYGIVLTDISCM